MTGKLLKVFHFVALCVFIGSIPTHIILGVIAQSSTGAESFAAIHHAKYVLTFGLTGTGIALSLVSGALLVLTRKAVLRKRWMRTKLLLVVAIVFNGVIVLSPLAEQMKVMAMAAVDSGALSPDFHAVESQEAVAGAVNLTLILIVIILAVVKPSLGSKSREA
jgi:uncharacterized membrane protein